MKKQNIKYQGGNTGVTPPFSGLSHCMNASSANYLWHCNFGTDTIPLCAWSNQEYMACTETGLIEINCTDHSMHSAAQLSVAYDDSCCMPLDCEGEGCMDPTACNYNDNVAVDDGSCLIGGWDCLHGCGTSYCDGTSGCDACNVCNGPGPVESCCDGGSVCNASIDCIGIVCGCMETYESTGACNYNPDATVDPWNDCSYGVQCDSPCEAYYECDSADCPVSDCIGECDGDAIIGGGCDPLECCEGNAGACSEIDECGVCGGGGIADGDCDCDGNEDDDCGVCGGDGYQQVCGCGPYGEHGYPAGYCATVNQNGYTYSITCDCDGNCPDVCGVCNGDNGTCSTVTDIDENVYGTQAIGNQVWTTSNLKTTHYNDGSDIPLKIMAEGNMSVTVGNYGIHSDDDELARIYGGYWYNCPATKGNLCPVGWHVPTDADWQELEMELGMSEFDAGRNSGESWSGGLYPDTDPYRGADELVASKMGYNWERYSYGWCSYTCYNGLANDGNCGSSIGCNDAFGGAASSGLNLKPAGNFGSQGGNLGKFGMYWASTGTTDTNCYSRDLYCQDTGIWRTEPGAHLGFGVRCVQD